jgi:hypothetical protein
MPTLTGLIKRDEDERVARTYHIAGHIPKWANLDDETDCILACYSAGLSSRDFLDVLTEARAIARENRETR